MQRPAALALVALAMAAIIVAVDVAFFRHHFWPRLMGERRNRPRVRCVGNLE